MATKKAGVISTPFTDAIATPKSKLASPTPANPNKAGKK